MWDDVLNSLWDEIIKERTKKRHEARIQIL